MKLAQYVKVTRQRCRRAAQQIAKYPDDAYKKFLAAWIDSSDKFQKELEAYAKQHPDMEFDDDKANDAYVETLDRGDIAHMLRHLDVTIQEEDDRIAHANAEIERLEAILAQGIR
jgi:hypothetical protein